MKKIKTDFPDVYIFEPDVHRDERGYFLETFNHDRLYDIIGNFKIIQSNQSKSKYGVIRGLHFQKPPYCQAKLVNVIKGKVLDVIVDLRTDSPTYGKYFSIQLSSFNKKILFVPKGFAHGFIVLSKKAIFQYFVDNQYSKEHESGIKYNDDDLNIDWRIAKNIVVSEKDCLLKGFKEQTFYTKKIFNNIS